MEVVTHAGEAPTRTVRHLLRFLRLFFETDHAVVRVNFDNTEFASFFDRHRDGRNREEGCTAQVEINHLVDVHLVNVVATENSHEVRAFVGNQVDVLENGVGSTAVPFVTRTHLGGHEVHILVQTCIQAPGGRNVLVQRIALELRQNLDLENAGIDEIVEDEVDNAVGSAKVYGGFCTVAGEGL